MKALRYYGARDFRIEEVPDPVPGPGEIRVRMEAVGICGTDLEMYDGVRIKPVKPRPGSFDLVPPRTLGHELAGRVDAVGTGVTNVKEGDLIGVESHEYDGSCRYCLLGREHLCVRRRAFGLDYDGGMAEYLLVPARNGFVLPPGVDAKVGALIESLGCCVHGMDALSPLSGLPMVIFGAGVTALMHVALARLAGVRPLVVIEPDAGRRATAEAMGATHTIDPEQQDWVERCLGIAGPEGFDYIIETVDSPRVLEDSFKVAARGAKILIFARYYEQATVDLQYMYSSEISVIAAVINPYVTSRSVALMPYLGLEQVGFGTFPLEAYADGFEARRNHRFGKVEFAPQL